MPRISSGGRYFGEGSVNQPAEDREWDLPVPNRQWLAKHTEDVLLPDLPILDPHFHLWRIGAFEYGLEEYLSDVRSGHNVVASIYMEASAHYRPDGPEELKPVGETEFAYRQVHASGGAIAGMVSRADLRAPDNLARVIDSHEEAGQGRFCGIRDMADWDPDPNLRDERFEIPPEVFELPEFRRSLQYLGKREVVCDLWLFHPQLKSLAAAAAAAPETMIVVNHTGGVLGKGPYDGRRDQVFTDWENGMRSLAACPNVYVKLGGMGMRWPNFGFHLRPKPPASAELAEAWGPWFRRAIELFGPDRCMFESNFPVDHEVCSYATLWNTYKRVAQDLSASEQNRLFFGTAHGLYRVILPGTAGSIGRAATTG